MFISSLLEPVAVVQHSAVLYQLGRARSVVGNLGGKGAALSLLFGKALGLT